MTRSRSNLVHSSILQPNGSNCLGLDSIISSAVSSDSSNCSGSGSVTGPDTAAAWLVPSWCLLVWDWPVRCCSSISAGSSHLTVDTLEPVATFPAVEPYGFHASWISVPFVFRWIFHKSALPELPANSLACWTSSRSFIIHGIYKVCAVLATEFWKYQNTKPIYLYTKNA